MNKYKLYVWDDVLSDYTTGIAFAIAKTKKQAVELLLSEWDAAADDRENNIVPKSHTGTCGYTKSEFKKQLLKFKPTIHDLNSPIAYFIGGGS